MSFDETQAGYRDLKAQFDAGALSEDDFKSRLQELMIQDDQGRWWVIGYETGQWYVHDGEQWVPAEPPAPPAPVEPPPLEASLRPKEESVLVAPAQLEASTGLLEEAPSAAAETAPATFPEERDSRTSAVPFPAAAGRRWVSVSIIAVGWGIGGLVAGLMMANDSGSAPVAIGLAVLIGGAATAFICRREEDALRWYHVLLLSAGLFIAYWLLMSAEQSINGEVDAILLLVASVSAGPLLIGLVLRWANPAFRWRRVAILAVAWALAGGIGLGVAFGAYGIADSLGYSYSEKQTLQLTVWGLILGALGGWATLDQLVRARRAAAAAPQEGRR